MFCILDTETTGLDPKLQEIIQFACVLCDNNLNKIKEFSFRVHPQHIQTASIDALNINGYDPSSWDPNFPNHKAAFMGLNDFLAKNNINGDIVIPVGQNIKFDMDFLTSSYEREGVLFPFSFTTLDLIDISKIWAYFRNVRLRRHSLKYLSTFTGIVNNNPHDAIADVETTLSILKWFIDDLKKGGKDARKCFSKDSPIKV
jgi:DNA polymerase III alpha subunit (gram-positive type)